MNYYKVFNVWCQEDEIRMVLSDSTICFRCGTEVWFDDYSLDHTHSEYDRKHYGWVAPLGKKYFKVNSFGQEHYLPSQGTRRAKVCSFCCFHKRISDRDATLRSKRDSERRLILSWLKIHNPGKYNTDELNELINLKRTQIIINRHLKKQK